MRIKLFLIIIFIFLLHANAKAQNVMSVKPAITNLQSLLGNTAAMTQTINSQRFGNLLIVTKCSYCSYAWGSLCWQHSSAQYSWNFTKLPAFFNQLNVQNQILINDLSSFNTFYKPFSNWFLITLPDVDATLSNINNADPAITQANIDQAIAKVTNAKDQLQIAILSINAWSGKVKNDISGIHSFGQQLQNYFSEDNQNFNTYISKLNCSGDLASQWTATATNATNVMAAYLNLLNAQGITVANVNTDFSYILGAMTTLETKLQGVFKELKNASITPNTAIKTVHSAAAAEDWNQLISFAKAEFK